MQPSKSSKTKATREHSHFLSQPSNSSAEEECNPAQLTAQACDNQSPSHSLSISCYKRNNAVSKQVFGLLGISGSLGVVKRAVAKGVGEFCVLAEKYSLSCG